MPPVSTVTFKGTTNAGSPATLTLEVEEPELPPVVEQRFPGPIAVGTTVDKADFAFLRPGGRDYGSKFARTFSPPDSGFLPWTATNRRLPTGVAEFHSWKDWTSDAAAVAGLTSLLDGMPAALVDDAPLLPHLRPYDPDGYTPDSARESDGLSLLVTWAHEGERNMIEAGVPAREWRRRHRIAYKTIRQHRNGHRVGYMSVGTLTWLAAKSDPSKGVVKGDYDPFAWWSGVGDFAAIDCYAPSITSGSAAPAMYPSPAAFFELLEQLVAGTGRRPFVPELGIIRQGSPADTGGLRANWITNCVQYLDSIGCGGVAWWDAVGSKDFRLTDAASATAWKAEIDRVRV